MIMHFTLASHARLICRVFLTLSLAWGATRNLSAAPFAEQLSFTQPDGTVTALWGAGDEFHAVFETLEGYSVIFDPRLKAYCYAALSADGADLVSTGTQVHQATGASLGLPLHLRITTESVRRKVAERYARWEAGMEVSTRWSALKTEQGARETEGITYAPPTSTTVGTKVGLCLLIDFDDDPATIPQAEIVDFCNGDNFTQYSNNGSVKKYFQDVSNGLLTYSNVVTIYIRIPSSLHPKSYYNDTTKDAGEQANLLIKDALDTLKALPDYDTVILPTFDALTVNAQDRVIACNVFYAGGNGGVWAMGLWPHSWSLVRAGEQELSPGGKKIYRYQITNIGSSLKIGTFCHENGHMLCGFPDIYDYDYDSRGGAGVFCLMNSGGSGGNPVQVCAYLKRAAGWTTVTDLTSSSVLLASVTALPGPDFNRIYRYRKPGTSTEYFLFECRFKTNRDSSLPASGVAVWHIDELGDRDDQRMTPNTLHNNYECTLVQADNQWHFQKDVNAGDNFDLYHSGNTSTSYDNTFTDTSTPNARWWNGANSGLNLNHFSARAPTMTFVVGNGAPAITNQPPATLAVTETTNVLLRVGATGLPSLRYQWQKEGGAIAGASTSTFQISNVQITDAGTYSVLVWNDYGNVTSTDTILTVISRIPLAEALDATNLTWTTDGNAMWNSQVTVTQDQVDAGVSGNIGHNQQSRVQTLVSGPGTVTFWWKVSSQATADVLRFSLGGVELAAISGEVEWQQRQFDVPPGYQALEWVYAKDASLADGTDKAWLDSVTFTAIPMPPVILTQPQDVAVLRGSPVSLSVSAQGSPPIAYQWRLNGADIMGATDAVLNIASVRDTDAGVYTVRLSNGYGFILSSNATVGLTLLGTAGDGSVGQTAVMPAAVNLVAIAGGAWHTLCLRTDGRVVAWGDNWDGQCNVPGALSRVVAIAAGGYHNLAVQADGTVAAWGADYYHQARVPANLRDVLAVAAGAWHSLALKEDGSVVAWGDNSSGQTSVPPGLNEVIAIGAGGNHSLALRRNGTVAAWGANTDAQGLWSGQSVIPPGLNNVVAIAAGDFHSLALKADGTVVGWGGNSHGQARAPAGLVEVVGLAAGGQHSLALQRDGIVRAWGNNWNGQCNVPAGEAAEAIAAGSYHTLVLLDSGWRPTQMFRTGKRGTAFGVTVQTQTRGRYALEFTDSLPGVNWTTLPPAKGNGALLLLTDPEFAGAQRYYRVRQF
jgi:M6 family metalloprotease-like protein